MLKRVGWFLLMVGSLVISYYAAQWLFKSWALSVALVGSIVLHELGHVFALKTWGISSRLVFIPLLGAVTIPQDGALKRLHHWCNAWVFLAGPLVNALIALFSLFVFYGLGGGKVWLQSASINASLAAFNALPIGVLDGGKFSRAVFNSLSEEADSALATIIGFLALAACILLVVLGKVQFFYLLIFWGIWRESGKDDPAESRSVRAMRSDQIALLMVIFLLILFGMWMIAIYIPFWLPLG